MNADRNLTIPVPEPRVARFEKLAFGMFIHWGLYSQLGEGEWVQHLKNIPLDEYRKLKDAFTARGFDARAIARLAKDAGMRYITLTTRHHEGFSLYDTRGLSDYDAPHSPAGRDLVAEFVEACRAEDILPFLYHTTVDWQWNGMNTATCSDSDFEKYLDYLHASVEILCTQYGPIGGLWFDGNWSRPQADWKEDRLYGLIRRLQPEAMIINNTGIGHEGVLGHSALDSVTFEQSAARPLDRRGHAKYVAGEMNQTLNEHWGVGAKDFQYKSIGGIIRFLACCRRAGANYLLNMGPSADGAIPELEAAMLRKVGHWTRMFADAIYEGKPDPDVKCQGDDFLLNAGGKSYYFAFDLNINGHENVTVGIRGGGPRAIYGLKRAIRQARWMDNQETLPFCQDAEAGLCALHLTGYPYGSQMVVRVAEIDY